MPFGLKNAGATYQRLIDTIFEGQIGRNLEAYVDDMVIKSKTKPEMIKDVEETLLTLKKVNMKLNPKKCSFRMEEGKFLGYIVTSEGIRANTKKAKVVVNMPSPSNLKQMQRLSNKLAALNRFLSKAAEKALPCLDTLKKFSKKWPDHYCAVIDVEVDACRVGDMFDTSVFNDEEVFVGQDMADQEVNVVEKDVSVVDPFTTAGEVVTTASVDINTASVPITVSTATPTTPPTSTTEDDMTLAETLMEIKSAKPKAIGVVMQEPSKILRISDAQQQIQEKAQGSRDKGKAKMVEEEEPKEPTKIKDQIKHDEELAKRLDAQLQAEMEK
ncbi:reverse transcriptase domain-containing protein [Tanacetum coccineum]